MSASPTGIHGRPVFHFNKGLRVGLKESSGSSNSFSGSGPDSARLPTDSAESSEDQEHRSTEVRICKSLSTGSLGELAARATQCVASCPLVVVKWDRFDFFKAMSDKLRQNVIDKSRPRTFMKGQKLVAEGTVGTSIFFFDYGVAHATLGGRIIQELRSGEVVGEMAFLSACRKLLVPGSVHSWSVLLRSCDVVAYTDCRCIELTVHSFLQAIQSCGSEEANEIQRVLESLEPLETVRRRRIYTLSLGYRPSLIEGRRPSNDSAEGKSLEPASSSSSWQSAEIVPQCEVSEVLNGRKYGRGVDGNKTRAAVYLELELDRFSRSTPLHPFHAHRGDEVSHTFFDGGVSGRGIINPEEC